MCMSQGRLAGKISLCFYMSQIEMHLNHHLMEFVLIGVYHYVLVSFYISRSSLCVYDNSNNTAIPENNSCIYSFCILYHARLSASIALISKVHVFLNCSVSVCGLCGRANVVLTLSCTLQSHAHLHLVISLHNVLGFINSGALNLYWDVMIKLSFYIL